MNNIYGENLLMCKKIKQIIRLLIPIKYRYFFWSIIPKIKKYHVFMIKRNTLINTLHEIDDRFLIRLLENNISDYNKLKKAYSFRYGNYFERIAMPRLKDSRWVCLVVENKINRDFAYVSWVVKGNVDFINDLGIKLKHNQFFLRDAYCVPQYRRQGLNTRMDQERINYCVAHGANEILFQIGDKAHADQNIIRKAKEYNEDWNEKGEKLELAHLKTNYILIIPRFNIHNDIFSFVNSIIKKIIGLK